MQRLAPAVQTPAPTSRAWPPPLVPRPHHPQVRLLLGEIPERAEFSVTGMRAPLQPYFELTTAVRSGDLATFRCGRVGVRAWRAQPI